MDTKKIKSKLFEWGRRYLPAEIMAITGALIGAFITSLFTKNIAVIAGGGTIGENLGYLARILFTDIKERKKRDKKLTGVGFFKVIRNLIVEFGLADILDSLIIRPLCMYYGQKWTHNLVLGIILGKLLSDTTFYLPVIIFYEIRKRLFKD